MVAPPAGAAGAAIAAFVAGLTAARQGLAGRYRGPTPPAAATSPAEQAAASQAAMDLFAALPALLGRAFLQPWAADLAALDPTQLIVVPHGALHLLPFHAAAFAEGDLLIERYPLSYLGSAALSETLLQRRAAATRALPLVMGPPGADLPLAAVETQELAERWGVARYDLEKMRIARLRQHTRPGAAHPAVSHLATHSAFDFDDYLRSFIAFHDERLTLFDLIGDETLDFQGVQLFYLSSCESGLAQAGAGDELQGLVWALTYAGAQAVMASLWPVADDAARHMASAFYDRWQAGMTLQDAYRATLCALRAEPEYANPYFWAPFVLFGDAYQTAELPRARKGE